MIRVTLNMPSAVECRERLGNCQGIAHCLESGHLQVTNVDKPM